MNGCHFSLATKKCLRRYHLDKDLKEVRQWMDNWWVGGKF